MPVAVGFVCVIVSVYCVLVVVQINFIYAIWVYLPELSSFQ